MQLTDRDIFAIDCRFVALLLGEVDERAVSLVQMSGSFDGNPAACLVYRDDVIEIVADNGSFALAVEKLENGNPVVSKMADGTHVRDHGEQVHLFDHVRKLALEAANTPVEVWRE
jgi:hypothetical protein